MDLKLIESKKLPPVELHLGPQDPSTSNVSLSCLHDGTNLVSLKVPES